MDVATLQRKLLGLIRGTYQPAGDEDPYVRAVAHSENLKLVREIALFWRMFHIELYCPLTSRMLKKRDDFVPTVSAFMARRGVLPFVEEVGSAFLEEMSGHADPLVASVARLESALIKVKSGDPTEYVVHWTHEPHAVLEYLLNDAPVPGASLQGHYRTVISRDCSSLFRVV